MADPERGGWWSFTKRGGYRIREAGQSTLGRILGAIGIRPKKTITPIKYRDDYIASRKEITSDLATRLVDGDISLNGWLRSMRRHVQDAHVTQYILARGGLGNMTQADWQNIGTKVREQLTFLNDFAAKIADHPEWSDKRIAARSQMYMEASGTSFEIGKQGGFTGLRLPAHPGDGATQCLSNCKCFWDIKESRREYVCTWILSRAEHCPDCVENSRKWNPLVLPKLPTTTKADLPALLRAYE